MASYDWAMCDKNTGNIQYIMSVNNNSDYSEAGFYGEYRTFQVDSAADHVRLVEETYYDYDSDMFLSRNKRPTSYYKWTDEKRWEVDTTYLMKEFRRQRDSKLFQSDWTQMADSPLTDESKANWATYRQTLRDLPKNLPEDFDTPDGFAWPSEPSQKNKS